MEAAATFLGGLGLGLLYEIFGELRSRTGRLAGAALDVLFCILFAWALFLLGMGPGRGQLRLYMPLLTLLCMALWRKLFGEATRQICGAFLDQMKKLGLILLRPMKKIQKIFKNKQQRLASLH